MIDFKFTVILITDFLLNIEHYNAVSYVTENSPVVAFYNKCKLKKVHISKLKNKYLTIYFLRFKDVQLCTTLYRSYFE